MQTHSSSSYSVADAHVDVLWRMEREGLDFYEDACGLMASYDELRAGGVKTQVFALFTSPTQSPEGQLNSVLRQLDLFHQRVVRTPDVRLIQSQADVESAALGAEISALLSIEGGGCLSGQVHVLRTMHRLGVRGLGLTWNRANELADGCLESRSAGLTSAGREIVQELSRLHMWVDLAHLADAGVMDVFRHSNGAVMASHANARAVQNHPRNLTDTTITEIVRRKGWIGLTFEASFVGDVATVARTDLYPHIDHMLSLGAEDVLGFGSDFDGTSNALSGLARASDYVQLADELELRYGKALTEKVLYHNFQRFLHSVLA